MRSHDAHALPPNPHSYRNPADVQNGNALLVQRLQQHMSITNGITSVSDLPPRYVPSTLVLYGFSSQNIFIIIIKIYTCVNMFEKYFSIALGQHILHMSMLIMSFPTECLYKTITMTLPQDILLVYGTTQDHIPYQLLGTLH